MSGKLPSFFKETIWAMLNLCLTVYVYVISTIVTGCGYVLLLQGEAKYYWYRVWLSTIVTR